MSRGLVVLAVDDERAVLRELQRMLEATQTVERVVAVHDARVALAAMAEEEFDVVFLDVEMPGVEGMALARVMQRFAERPELVFISGHAQRAAEAFDVDALDFVVKPVTRERLDRALERIQRRRGAEGRLPERRRGNGNGNGAGSEAGPIALERPGGGTVLVRPDVISLVSAEGDHVRVHAGGQTLMLRHSLSELEQRWAPMRFVRVHRAHLVNLDHASELVAQLNGTAVLVLSDGKEVPVSRRAVMELRRRLGV